MIFNVLLPHLLKEHTQVSELFPPTSMTGFTTTISGHGDFTTMSSSQMYNDWPPWKAFNYVIGNEGWHTPGWYNSTSGNYTGTNSLGGYSGEYIILQLPYSKQINRLKIAARPNILSRCIKSGVLLGSNDGNSWDTIYEWTTASYIANVFTTFSFPTSSAYSYFAVLARQIFSDTSLNVSEIQFEYYI